MRIYLHFPKLIAPGGQPLNKKILTNTYYFHFIKLIKSGSGRINKTITGYFDFIILIIVPPDELIKKITN